MKLYQIIMTHNRPWTAREIVAFLLIFLAAAIVSGILFKHNKLVLSQVIAVLTLLTFLSIVFASTVFTRTPSSEHTYELEFFWSWKQVFQGNKALFEENLLNIILLFPAGLLLPVIYRKTLSWQKGFFSGAFISFGIEFLQLVLARGLFEWDDIVHNGLGCMAGCIISSHFLKNKM